MHISSYSKKCKSRILIISLLIFILLIIIISKIASLKEKIIIIGIDGADPDVIRELIANRDIPNLEFLIKNGCFGIHNPKEDLHSLWSPVIWTSVATGRSPEYHGINSELCEDLYDNSAIFFALSKYRKVPALWDIFSQYGKQVAIINWWVTFPASKVKGCMVTSFAFNIFKDIAEIFLKKNNVTTKLNFKNLKGFTYPQNLLYDLKEIIHNPHYENEMDIKLKQISKKLSDVLISDKTEVEVFDPQPKSAKVFYKLKDLAAFYELDKEVLAITEHLLNRTTSPDLVMTYFLGVDTFSHIFWYYRCKDFLDCYQKEKQPFYNKNYCHLVNNYYKIIDAYIGKILKFSNKNDIIIVCSDHGFELRNDFAHQLMQGRIRTGEHRSKGVIFIYGNHIKKNIFLPQVSLLDIFPTVLYLKGLPLSKDLEGRILFECIDDKFSGQRKPVFVQKYRFTTIKSSDKDFETCPFREDMLKRLRTLGYLN